MCGVSAILLGDTKAGTAAVELFESLFYLQHRGQDAAGIAVCQGGRVYSCKGNGMAAKVFDEGRRTAELPGFMGISHLRYPTAGSSSASEAQPFYVNSPMGLLASVNGNLTNATELSRFLDYEAHRHINTDSDSELLLNVWAHALNELGKSRTSPEDIFIALREVYAKCKGAYACTAMVAGFGILGFRDANGIRPLCLGSRPSLTVEGVTDYLLASESIALTQLGFSNVQDILPGQAVFIEKGKAPIFSQIAEATWTPDIFEFVYFARPDSTIDGISVHRSRENMGRKLAKKIQATLSKEAIEEIDVVIPVPETSNTSAAILAKELDKPFSNAFIKNRYVYRTFILPGNTARRRGIRRKLSPITSEFKDRVVLLVDDSIVRGNTSREIVQMAKDSGAKKVLFASCSSAISHPHVHGIDLADPAELIAHEKTTEEIAIDMGASELIYQDLQDLKDACIEAGGSETTVKDFEVGVFNGKYSTEVPADYFEHLSNLRANKKRKAAAIATDGKPHAICVANGGPVNVASARAAEEEDAKRAKAHENQEDISLYNFAAKA